MTMIRKSAFRHVVSAAALGASALILCGCNGRPTLFANPDPTLNRPSTEFAADAAKRFPYKADAPHAAEPKARAQAAYSLNRLEVVNFTGQDWSDVEVWVNRKYVCHLPKLEDRKLKEVHFPMLFDDTGRHFPMDNREVRVEKVELYCSGRMYELVCRNADY